MNKEEEIKKVEMEESKNIEIEESKNVEIEENKTLEMEESKNTEIEEIKNVEIKESNINQKRRPQSRDIERYVERTKELLREEYESELEDTLNTRFEYTIEELQSKGVCIPKLKLVDRTSGLYGKTLLHFCSRVREVGAGQLKEESKEGGPGGPGGHGRGNKLAEGYSQLPKNRWGPGDIVGIFRAKHGLQEEPLSTGIIYRISNTEIIVAISKAPDYEEESDSDFKGTIALLILANDITYRRSLNAIQDIHLNSFHSNVKNIIFLGEEARFQTEKKESRINPFEIKLNSGQLEAIKFALSGEDIALIHGPPGTGKTTTIVEYIKQEVARGSKVLACGPSNISVDNMAEKLIFGLGKVKICRLGHPARLQVDVLPHCLDAQAMRADSMKVVMDTKREILKSERELSKEHNKRKRSQMVKDIRALKRDIRQFEEKAVWEVLDNCDVLLSTNTGCGSKKLQRYISLKERKFDVVVIDEAAQATEPACWIPIRLGRKLVMAGDHKQLEPTVKSKAAIKGGLGITLFESLLASHPYISRLLTTQYRMNSTIMGWSSAAMYQGKLVAHKSVAAATLLGIKDMSLRGVDGGDEALISKDLLFVDTAGAGVGEAVDAGDETQSKSNVGEADLIIEMVKSLKELCVLDEEMGIITPYNAQVNLISRKLEPLHSNIEVNSVDGFQGREKEVILISTVRSNPSHSVGFLGNKRRMNVAITRARTFICLVGDSETLSQGSEFLRGLCEYFGQHGQVVSAQTYEGNPGVEFHPGVFQLEHNPMEGRVEIREKSSVELESVAREKHIYRERKRRKLEEERSRMEGRRAVVEREIRERRRVEVEEEEVELGRVRGVIDEYVMGGGGGTVTTVPLELGNLSNTQRRRIHEYATEVGGLVHVSEGRGEDRKLIISKKVDPPMKIRPEPPPVPVEGTVEANIVKEAQAMLKEQPELVQEELKIGEGSRSKKSKKKRKNKGNTDKKDQGVGDPGEDEDIHEYLEKLVYQNQHCKLPNCKKNIEIFGRLCPYCKEKYCLEHVLPKEHGCQDKALEYSMKVTHDSFSKPETNILKQKMQNKLNEMKSKRAPKTKKK